MDSYSKYSDRIIIQLLIVLENSTNALDSSRRILSHTSGTNVNYHSVNEVLRSHTPTAPDGY
ncbi:hypothetical protein X975_04303, partial [Stegodyphus mimosarum]